MTVLPGTLAHRAYGRERIEEQFSCNYGVNRGYRDEIETGELRVTGTDPDGEVRIIELDRHRFFVATLFVPQLSSSLEQPHPLISAFLGAALAYQAVRLAKFRLTVISL